MQQHIAFDRLAAGQASFRECSKQHFQVRTHWVGGVWRELPPHRQYRQVSRSKSMILWVFCYNQLFIVKVISLIYPLVTSSYILFTVRNRHVCRHTKQRSEMTRFYQTLFFLIFVSTSVFAQTSRLDRVLASGEVRVCI
jgi:hypothetical protein